MVTSLVLDLSRTIEIDSGKGFAIPIRNKEERKANSKLPFAVLRLEIDESYRSSKF